MPYPRADGYDTELLRIANTYPDICRRVLINDPTQKTHDGRDVYGLRIGKALAPAPPSVMIIGGIHAREWAPPDALLSFAEKLAEAYTTKKPLVLPYFFHSRPPIGPGGMIDQSLIYPELVLAAPALRNMIENLSICIVPLVNPDGRLHSFSSGADGWRGNRRTYDTECPEMGHGEAFIRWMYGLSIPENGHGVDNNRNFGDPPGSPLNSHSLWDYEEYYNPAGAAQAKVMDTPCSSSQTYRGPEAGSEPETRAIQRWINREQVTWFLDVHSFGRLVMHPWGMDVNGNDSTQTFKDASWNRSGALNGRDGGTGNAYNEYMPNSVPDDHLGARLAGTAEAIASGIYRCAGGPGADLMVKIRSTYRAQQSVALYPSTGGSTDYAFSRQFLPGGWGPVFAFTIECGTEFDEGGFQPSSRIFPKIEREVHAGVFTFLELAANATISAGAAPPLPPVQPPSSGTSTVAP